MKFVLALALTALSFQAHADSCQISGETANALLQARVIDLQPQARYQHIREALLNDSCVQAKRLQSSEIHDLIQKVEDFSIQDNYLIGEINEYLAM